jgi:hypothetical protein
MERTNLSSWSRGFCLGLMLPLVGACAATTSMSSNKTERSFPEPKRMYVLVHDRTFGEAFDSAFKSGFEQLAASCGMVITVGFVSPLELDESVHDRNILGFSADAALVVSLVHRTLGQYGDTLNASYDLRLVDVLSRNVIWRANARVSTHLASSAKIGESLSSSIGDKLKQDKILRTCV